METIIKGRKTLKTALKERSMMKTVLRGLVLLTGVATWSSCSDSKQEFDAMGVFEATEITVSAKAQGELIRFTIDEGDEVVAGDTLGLIDITKLSLQQQGLMENREALTVRILNLQEQTASLGQQMANAQKEYDRFASLLEKGAATQKQVDDIGYQTSVLKRQLDAAKSQLQAANEAFKRQAAATSRQIDVVDSQMLDAVITSPVDGTILNTHTEQGEYALPGKPLFTVANLKKMTLRAYITAPQYDRLKLGQTVTVKTDHGEENQREYKGKVTWIADKAEFTPKTIQTRDERANLVYAIKIRVENDGFIKIGQYGECYFGK